MTDPILDATTKRNKSLIATLYAKVYNERDMAVLTDIFADNYVEHSPELENGRTALGAFLDKIFGLFPEMGFTLARLVAEGDLVVAHALMRRKPDDRGTAVVEIFRFSDDKIVERWDITASVPEETKNGNPMV